MTRRVGAGIWTAALLGAIALAGCKKDSSSSGASSTGLGVPTPLLWLDTSSSGAGSNADTPLLWNDPQTGPAAQPPNDPSDIRTYTNPDIYIIGNKHPMMTQVLASTHPFIIGPENGLTKYIQDYRYQEFVKLTGNPPARGARVDEYVMLRQIARAHSKHFAVWHADIPFAYTNPEGDRELQSGVFWGDGIGDYFSITILPDGSSVPHNIPPLGFGSEGIIPKCRLQVDYAGSLILAGTGYMDPFVVFTTWVTSFDPFILYAPWTHMGVGYWRMPGTTLVHYWTLVMATNPQSVGGGTTTFPLPFP